MNALIQVRKQAVTLLEMLVVIAILAIAAGIVSIGVSRAMVDQRFRNEVGMIVDELRLAQDLMLILKTDVRMKFAEAPDKASIIYWLEIETQVNNSLQREIMKKQHHLKTIRVVIFHDEGALEEIDGTTKVNFLSQGAVMSRGIMHLTTSNEGHPSKNVLQTYIPLAGFPGPIVSIDDKDKADAIFNEFDNVNFDRALTQDTFSKLPDNLKPSKEDDKQEEEKKKGEEEKVNEQAGPGGKPGGSPQGR